MWEKLQHYEQFKLNEYNLFAKSLATGLASVMINRTHSHKEDWVDISKKEVTESKILDYLKNNVDGWDKLHKDKQDEVFDYVVLDFQKAGYEIKD